MEQNINITNAVIGSKMGDSAAFTELYNASYRMVYQICLGHLKNQEDAEDATQEVYITAFKKISTLQDNNTFFGWIKTIAVHTSLNIIQAKNRHNIIAFDDAVQNEDLIDGDDNLETLPDAYIMKSEKRKIVLDILRNELSEVQYQTVFMHYFDGLNVEQIASIMQCSTGTVKSRLKLARVKIKSGIIDYEEKTGDRLAGAACTLPFLSTLFNTHLSSTPMRFIPFASGKAAMELTKIFKAGKAVPNPATQATTPSNPAKPSNGKGHTSRGKDVVKTAATKSIITKIVAGISALAVIGVGAVAVTNLMNKDNTPTNKKDSDESSATTIIEETTLPTETEFMLPTLTYLNATSNFDYETAYLDVISNLTMYLPSNIQINSYNPSQASFALVPIDDDGIPELLIKYSQYEGQNDYYLYTYSNGLATFLDYFPQNNIAIQYVPGQNSIKSGYAGYNERSITYNYINDDHSALLTNSIYANDNATPGEFVFKYSINGSEVDEDTFNNSTIINANYVSLTDSCIYTYSEMYSILSSETIPPVHGYQPVVVDCTMEEAQEMCESMGGSLLYIDTTCELSSSVSNDKFNSTEDCYFYIDGCSDELKGYSYLWAEGADISSETICIISVHSVTDMGDDYVNNKLTSISSNPLESNNEYKVGFICEYIMYGNEIDFSTLNAPSVMEPVNWGAVYQAAIDNNSFGLYMNSSDCNYRFLYINDDDIPELIVTAGWYDAAIFTVHNNQLTKILDFYDMIEVLYIPRQNTIVWHDEFNGDFDHSQAYVYFETYDFSGPELINNSTTGTLNQVTSDYIGIWELNTYSCNEIIPYLSTNTVP
ncbi:MAG: sigma-70 family RNA polymerase sigma factor [Saccharofermentans sp.]|nr:sigma-70 family RNA polymerase sigma factor [Saccharofermentans sp.]